MGRTLVDFRLTVQTRETGVCAVARVTIYIVNASAVVAEIRHTIVNVCFTVRASKPRKTMTRVHVYIIDANGVVVAWTRRTVVDICAAVVSCITDIAEALLLRCSRVVQTRAVLVVH